MPFGGSAWRFFLICRLVQTGPGRCERLAEPKSPHNFDASYRTLAAAGERGITDALGFCVVRDDHIHLTFWADSSAAI
jgi:hypothetical protein